MATRNNALGPQCIHHRRPNGIHRSDCVHCARPVADTCPASHTAGPKGLSPDIDPFFGFKAAVGRNLDVQKRISYSETQRRNMMSTGLKTYDPIPKNRKIWQTVDGMNNRYMNVRETKSRLNTVYSEMDQDCCIQDQHRSNPFDMTNELGEHVRAESDDSNTSLREAIRRDLHQCAVNLVRANRAAKSELRNQGSRSGYGFVGNPDIDPGLTMPETLYPSMSLEHVISSIEESKVPYPYLPLTSFINRRE